MPVARDTDPAFDRAGGQVGIEVWRVQNFNLVKADEAKKGDFYSGDSYLVLHTSKLNGLKLQHNIHFWMGAKTSNDEAGVVAIKAVELDDLLGGAPVQHREVQGAESPMFKGYFNENFKIKEGGHASGFKKVQLTSKNRLYQIKGTKRAVAIEKPCVWESINSGDVFVLDTTSAVYLFKGAESNKYEKMQALKIASNIRNDEHHGNVPLHDLDESQLGKLRDHPKFFSALNVNPEKIHHISKKVADDVQFEHEFFVKLFRVHVPDGTKEAQIDEVANKELKQDMLDEKDTFIIDYNGKNIFIWQGSKSNKEEKVKGYEYAMTYLKREKYETKTPVTINKQHAESVQFRYCFSDLPWKHREFNHHTQNNSTVSRRPEKVSNADLVKSLHKKKQKVEAKQFFDDGNTGLKKVWRIENMKPVAVNASKVGLFYSGDCYVVQYTYHENGGHGKEKTLIYFWIGANSTVDEQGVAAAHAVELDDSMGGSPVQVRVVQGKEPEHFMKIFKGTLIVRLGGVKSGFKNQPKIKKNGVFASDTSSNVSEDYDDSDGSPKLFHIKGSSERCCKAVEVSAKASNLNSNDVFVLTAAKQLATWVWCGEGASRKERKVGALLAEGLLKPQDSLPLAEDQHVEEGHEPADFWVALGGKADYAKIDVYDPNRPDFEPRLFQVSNASGRIDVEEICEFAQADLSEEDVMILDLYEEVYIWIGADANFEERKAGLEIAKEYVTKDTTGRSPGNTVMLMVKQGHETPNFRASFAGWDFRRLKPAKSVGNGSTVTPVAASSVLDQYKRMVYPYEELKGGRCPPGVDACAKEEYLNEEEFLQVFGRGKAEWKGLPLWKKKHLKMSVQLW